MAGHEDTGLWEFRDELHGGDAYHWQRHCFQINSKSARFCNSMRYLTLLELKTVTAISYAIYEFSENSTFSVTVT